ncbi:hypothetical protein UFOVP1147_50 [uncultured Caudovirales phage]|uniref:Uncharacterized protein n=1 Tax=uncultured Caudovirales phage TaxID=2100421 RepID=A0A6J5SR59_9CAUD|nr:hypothetical protein UFOVP484_23 [uncultured Caudovirales phage]CAB4163695.1 hypothetical protein UFOVP808_39 [uncultured Caudovirales phage]CAB4175988.1 hypothetical protein UFOVP994_46 [uncultured Caudovirales phage]CAB4186525.1 hypothetical protein UFOVP1147_50 [uncultured Caudovirales phage]CAB4217606.1 hypothetical protein UFOVP1594_46 [uncultured Caudovirales phage]
MNTEEDEFKRLEREARRKAQEDDDTQVYKSDVRAWQGLTDEEIGQLAATHLFRDVWPHSTFAAIHAIEAKLKEKNNG